MYLVTAEQMRQADRMTIQELGIPEMVLMENAGKAVVEFLQETFTDLTEKAITIVAGAGNNGGDALVAARYLHLLGVPVKVFIYADRELSPSAKQNYEILSRLPVKMYWLDSENSMHLLKVTVNYSDIFIDGLLGTGVNRDVSGQMEQIIDIANRRSCVKVAIDVPSGLNSDTGEIWGRCLKADYTVALAQPKRGHMLNKGMKYCGQVVVKKIGIPNEIYEKLNLNCQIIDENCLKPCKEPRNRSSHKGSFGHLLAVGGSMGMSGAMTLTAQAALRSGVGLVSCAVPESVQLHVAVNVPEAMVQPMPEGSRFSMAAIEPMQELLRGKKAVVAGPGMGTGEATGESDGYVSFIIPKNLLHISSYKMLREKLLREKRLVSVIELGIHFKTVRGEQIVLTFQNKYAEDNKIKFYQYNKEKIEFMSEIPQNYYTNEIIVFTGNNEVPIYNKLKESYGQLGEVCSENIRRGRDKSKDAIKGKQIRKFGFKDMEVPEEGNQIFIQNIFSAEAGIT
ncbi:MAG: NAD(P)H-hydrate epimerase, partial [Peptococcaceae bacterium]|nr:NAD(P)H-hydrate epimerase [Peptococcaceae bacterium]